MTTTVEPHCSDSCNIVASMASTFKEFVPNKQRMEQAIKAVQQGMSQREAALKFDVARSTLGDHLAKVGGSVHPKTSKSQPAISADHKKQKSDQARKSKTTRIRGLALANGIKKINGKRSCSCSNQVVYDALIAAGIEVPDELKPASKGKKTITPPKQHDTNEQGIPANDSLVVNTQWTGETDPQDNDAIFDERIDVAKMSAQVNDEVQRSNRPESFKRAIELATELESIITLAFYGQGEWSWQEFVHINGQLKTCQSLTGQRSEEAHSELLKGHISQNGAITV